MKFLQAHPKLAHRPSLVALPDCLLAKPLFYPPIIYRGERGEGRRGREEARRRKERNRRSHFPPFLPRTALRAVKRRWRTGQGARAATNERSPAGEKRVRKPPNEGGNAKGGRRKRSRGIDSSSGGEREMRRGEEKRGEERRGKVVSQSSSGFFPSDRPSSFE